MQQPRREGSFHAAAPSLRTYMHATAPRRAPHSAAGRSTENKKSAKKTALHVSVPQRPALTVRANRVRISWFTLGIISGLVLAYVTGALPRPAGGGEGIAAQTSPQTHGSLLDSSALSSLPGLAEQQLTDGTAAESSSPTFPMSLDLQVRPGDTLLTMLTDTDVPYDEAVDVVQAVKSIYNPRRLNVGQNLSLMLDKDQEDAQSGPNVSQLAIAVSPIESIKLTRKEDGNFKVEKVKVPLAKGMARAGGTITSSLYETGLKSGIPAHMLAELITAFSYDVDFQRDIKRGAKFDVLFENYQTPDGKTGGFGNVVLASLDLGDRTVTLYRHTDANGDSGYYNEKGESIRKALLKTPINGARLSSGFGMRHHPILGYSKMHKGVDFAAAAGTPIYAAGDGTVAFTGVKGGYGNYLQIKHNDAYATAYAHLSRYASGIAPGRKVRQGQVIAYVGSTGRSTGPHLHYEILVKGEQVNPQGVKFKTGNALSGKEMAAFKKRVGDVKTTLASLKQGQSKLLAQAK